MGPLLCSTATRSSRRQCSISRTARSSRRSRTACRTQCASALSSTCPPWLRCPTPSCSHSNLLAVAAETEHTFKEAEGIKAYLADPSAFASAAPAASAGGSAPAAAAAVEEEEEEEDMAPATNLFG